MAKGPYYPQGVYIGRVVRQELGTSSKKGTPQFSVTFEIVDALDPGGNPIGVTQTYERSVFLYLTEKAMEIALDALKTLGFNKASLKFLDPNNVGFCDFTGKEVELYCKHEEYEGDERERWSINSPREAKVSKPVDSADLRKLDALFGKALKSQAAPEPQPDSDFNKALQEAGNVDAEDSPF